MAQKLRLPAEAVTALLRERQQEAESLLATAPEFGVSILLTAISQVQPNTQLANNLRKILWNNRPRGMAVPAGPVTDPATAMVTLLQRLAQAPATADLRDALWALLQENLAHAYQRSTAEQMRHLEVLIAALKSARLIPVTT